VHDLLQASSTRVAVATAQPDGHPEGFTFLVLAQSLLGIGAAATTLTVIASVLTCLAMGWTWRRGLAPDGSRYLQLALLPMAATSSRRGRRATLPTSGRRLLCCRS
jgi:hypothetical protein